MLKRIKIEKLFDQFDYDIELKVEGITILTGPNGYGKTTVLKILDALALENIFYFFRLLFKKIVLVLSCDDIITLEKVRAGEVLITATGKAPAKLTLNKSMFVSALFNISKDTGFFSHLDGDQWIDHQTGGVFDTEAVFQKIRNDTPEEFYKRSIVNLPKISDIYFIREQRLLRPVSSNVRKEFINKRFIGGLSYQDDLTVDVFGTTIDDYAKELCESIKDNLAKSSQIAQELDSSFPRRLFDQVQEISEEEFTQRFDKVKETQKALSKFGLSDIKEDSHPTYKSENGKALCVYIDDTEKKLAVFAELLGKLNAFTDILNQRRFTFKRIDISRQDGFKFSTSAGTPLALGDLSSGEQQAVVMLYELLFKVQPGTLVLIDEPEISLHVAWQKQFLDDLFKIVALQRISVLIATHSPQIINNHWDLTVDLEEISRCETI